MSANNRHLIPRRFPILAFLTGVSILAVSMVTCATVFSAPAAAKLPAYFFEAVRPFVYNAEFFYVALGLGFCSGLCSGGLGIGGGALVVPGLMSLGVRGLMAVATDIFHSFVLTVLGMFHFKNRGGLHPKLIMLLAPAAILGAALGAFLNRSIYLSSPRLSELVINMASFTFLGLLAAYFFMDYLKMKKNAVPEEIAEEEEEPEPEQEQGGTAVSGTEAGEEEYNAGGKGAFLEAEGKAISPVKVVMGGVLVGLAMGLAGSVGGLFSLPMLAGLAGVPEFIVLGSDMSQGFLTTGTLGLGFYSSWGYVVYTIAAGLVLGSIPGMTLGYLSSVTGEEPKTRAVTAIGLGCLCLNRAMALPNSMAILTKSSISSSMSSFFDGFGMILLIAGLALQAVWILFRMFKELGKLRRNHPLDIVANGKNILIGCSLGLICLAVSFFFLFGIDSERSSFDRLNTSSNIIVKQEINKLAELQRANRPYLGTMFKLTLAYPSTVQAEKASFILHRLGVQITVDRNSLYLLGDFGYMTTNMLAGCAAVYDNNDIGVKKLLGMPARQALYSLRQLILDLEKAFAANGQEDQAKALAALIPEAIYPAYNFYEIPVDAPGSRLRMLLWAPLIFLVIATTSGIAFSMIFTGFGFQFGPAPATWKPYTQEELDQMRQERKPTKKKKPKRKKRARPKDKGPDAEKASGGAEDGGKPKKKVKKKRKKPKAEAAGAAEKASGEKKKIKKKKPLKKKTKKDSGGIGLDADSGKKAKPKKKPVKKKVKKKSGGDSINLDF